MKKTIIGIAIFAISLPACNSDNKTSEKEAIKNDTTQNNSSAMSSNKRDESVDGSMREMVNQYLQIKNALANDNGKEAATAANAYVESMGKMDKNSLTADKKTKWDNLSDDAKEPKAICESLRSPNIIF